MLTVRVKEAIRGAVQKHKMQWFGFSEDLSGCCLEASDLGRGQWWLDLVVTEMERS